MVVILQHIQVPRLASRKYYPISFDGDQMTRERDTRAQDCGVCKIMSLLCHCFGRTALVQNESLSWSLIQQEGVPVVVRDLL